MTALLTVAEVGARLRCNEWTVRQRIRRGEIPAVHDGKRYLIEDADVDAVPRVPLRPARHGPADTPQPAR